MRVELLVVIEGFKVRLDGQRHDSRRAVGQIVLDDVVIHGLMGMRGDGGGRRVAAGLKRRDIDALHGMVVRIRWLLATRPLLTYSYNAMVLSACRDTTGSRDMARTRCRAARSVLRATGSTSANASATPAVQATSGRAQACPCALAAHRSRYHGNWVDEQEDNRRGLEAK